MTEKWIHIIEVLSWPIGVLMAGGVVMLIAELQYRWAVHHMGEYPNSKQESFIKYLFMAWFVRNKKWYDKQSRR